MISPSETSPAPQERHLPVLLAEVIHALVPDSVATRGGLYLDGTLGLGGHAKALLAAAPGARLLGLDQDVDALTLASERLSEYGERVYTRQSRFADFSEHLDACFGKEALLDGALIDIGVSSLQLDSPERGFSFLRDGPLDMRMDQSGATGGRASAAKLVNTASFEVLREIIADLGEEPQAGRIARAIISAREKAPLTRTAELASVVEAAYPAAWRAKAKNHPATRTFQALRLAVNDELGQLKFFLERIVPRLAPGGRLAVISFHSLEDREVKHFFRTEAEGCLCPPHVPACVCGHRASLRILTKKPVCASPEEARANPRAGSAKLRVAEKLEG